MRTFKLEQSKTEIITPHGGLALVGHSVNRMTSLAKTSRAIVKRHGIANIDLIRTYLGLICLGKSDFEAVEHARHDPFFKAAMGIKQSPSSARLRQRFDEDACALIPLLDEASVEFLCNASVPVGTLATGHAPLDIDVFPMDNSNTKKEGVAYTYKGHDGYAPIAAYLGTEGWCLGCELRPGNQHGRCLSENGVRTALRDLGYSNETVTPHGFRATARTLLDEVLRCRVELIEHQLAHTVKDANGRAYNRTSFLEDRAEMMQVWADYLDKLRLGSQLLASTEHP